jgi:hypothetical protein
MNRSREREDEMKSIKIEDGLYLCELPVTPASADPPKRLPTHHVIVSDVSGSMSSDLPKMRKHLCDKLPKLLGKDDTCSLLYFSGRGEFGVIFENVGAENAKDLQDIRKMIDRWLVPIGLTGFKEPLIEVEALCKRASKKNPALQHSLFFMSDGCDNQWDKAQILAAVERAAGVVAASTFVEYGYYADRALLSAMADRAGGKLVFAEQFDAYEPILAAEVSGAVEGKRVEIAIPGDLIGGVAFAGVDGEIATFAPKDGKILVPENAKFVYFMAPEGTGEKEPVLIPAEMHSAMYAGLSVFSVRMQSKIVRGLLRRLGDVHFIDEFSVCFGKQKTTQFMQEAKDAAFVTAGRYTVGLSMDHMPAKDAFTVLELLSLLQSDERHRVLLDHPSFSYSRISRARVDADEVIDEEAQKELDRLAAEVAKAKTKDKVKIAKEKLNEFLGKFGQGGVKFTADAAPNGYPVDGLVWNEDRPNVSFQVTKTGHVDLSGRIPETLKGKIPETFPTKIVRNYAIVRDGLINIGVLPVLLTKDAFDTLNARCGSAGYVGSSTAALREAAREDGLVEAVLDLRRMPVLNQDDVLEPSAEALFRLQRELQLARCKQKVMNHYRNIHAPRMSKSFVDTYGKEGEEFLKSVGVKDYGFSPAHTIQAESKDFYMGKELGVTLKGWMTLPKVEDAKAGKKTDPASTAMKHWITGVEAAVAAAAKGVDVTAEIETEQKDAVAKCRALLSRIARMKFSMTVGQVWFKEFLTLDENSMKLSFDGAAPVDCKVEMKDIQIPI